MDDNELADAAMNDPFEILKTFLEMKLFKVSEEAQMGNFDGTIKELYTYYREKTHYTFIWVAVTLVACIFPEESKDEFYLNQIEGFLYFSVIGTFSHLVFALVAYFAHWYPQLILSGKF